MFIKERKAIILNLRPADFGLNNGLNLSNRISAILEMSIANYLLCLTGVCQNKGEFALENVRGNSEMAAYRLTVGLNLIEVIDCK